MTEDGKGCPSLASWLFVNYAHFISLMKRWGGNKAGQLSFQVSSAASFQLARKQAPFSRRGEKKTMTLS